MEARNIFHEGASVGILKCITGFNHYRRRDSTINKGLVGNKCSQCDCEETWEHTNMKKQIKSKQNI